MKPSMKLSIVCGVVPLILGIAVFLVSAFMLAGWVVYAGMTTLVVGLVCVLIGVVNLALWARQASRANSRSLWRVMLRTVLVLALYFAAACAAIVGALLLLSLYTVHVVNNGDAPLKDVQVTQGAEILRIGDVEPNSSVGRSFLAEEGALMLTGFIESERFEVCLDNVSGGGGSSTCVMEPDGTTRVTHP